MVYYLGGSPKYCDLNKPKIVSKREIERAKIATAVDILCTKVLTN